MHHWNSERTCEMKKLFAMLAAVSLGGCYATVGADGRPVEGNVSFTIGLPVILPPLVVIQPGVSVVSNMDREVFYADNYYWARQDQGWYRSRDHRTGWARVDNGRVPTAIQRSPPGQYRNYHGGQGQPGAEGHGHQHEDGNGGDHR
jgi:hypothetical protein